MLYTLSVTLDGNWWQLTISTLNMVPGLYVFSNGITGNQYCPKPGNLGVLVTSISLTCATEVAIAMDFSIHWLKFVKSEN